MFKLRKDLNGVMVTGVEAVLNLIARLKEKEETKDIDLSALLASVA